MKLFRVRFTTDNEMTPFGEVPGIIELSEKQGLNLHFGSGGWDKGEVDSCYHEWKSENDPGEVKIFLESCYGKFLIDMETAEIPLQPGSLSSNDNLNEPS